MKGTSVPTTTASSTASAQRSQIHSNTSIYDHAGGSWLNSSGAGMHQPNFSLSHGSNPLIPASASSIAISAPDGRGGSANVHQNVGNGHGPRQKSHGAEHSRNFSDTHMLSEQLHGAGFDGNSGHYPNGSENNFFSLRSNNHQASDSQNSQLEKLKKELAKVKKHNSKSRSQGRNGAPTSALKQVSANLKNEIITKYRARPDQASIGGINEKQTNTQSVAGGGAGVSVGQRGLSRSSSNVILQQTLVNNEKCVNTKVFARFRPLNKIEDELTKSEVGSDCCLYPDEKTVVLLPEQTVFTMDFVFDPNTSQHRIYEAVGHETISDVMNGYNGTIFAYGQTGSGKTYSMFGDIYKKTLKGLIPRSIEHIFKTINSCDVDIEFILTCSMLEIYKENLHDLLCIQKADLKIKESPTRGIYVEGLTQLCVGTENELLTMLELGEQARKVAATRINQYSSRSHTIFMLEIKQRYPNDTEKKGKLNLVDLAGSEKVGKTGAMGDILEEAKKINLSLSCLGNVIHSLTTNSEHIPYRDSKLTRILQESLGGNFKTSLLVTCSSHSSSLEETLSTLKFATRAKSIKNNFKMNIKNSPESLQRIIQQLKRDLMDAKTELDCIKRSNDIGIPNEEAIHLIQQNVAPFSKSPLNQAVTSTLDNVNKNIILQEKIEGQYSELHDLRSMLKESDAMIQKQEILIEKLKRENLQLQDSLSQAQQDSEVLQSKIQNRNMFSEKEIEERSKNITQIEKALHELNSVVQDLMREKMEQSELQLANVIGQGNQSYFGVLADLRNSDDILEKEKPANPLLRVQSNIHSTLKDIKYSIFNQRISSCRLREIAKKIEMQLNNNCNSSSNSSSSNMSVDQNSNPADTTILNLLFYETLRIETLHTSLECSIRSLEIQESLNFQKHKIIVQKYESEVKTSSSLQVILEKAMKTHSILRERIDNLEEDSAKHEENILNVESAASFIHGVSSPEKRKSKIIHSVQQHNQQQQLLLSTVSNAQKPVSLQLLDMLQDWFLEELQAHHNGSESVHNLIFSISQSVHSCGLRTFLALHQRIKDIIENEHSQGQEKKIQGENLSINQHIYVSENNRLQDKILVLMSELDLSNKKTEILEAELKKKNMEVFEIHELLRSTSEQSEKLQKEEFNKLRRQINESHKPIYQEILDFFKRQNSFTDSLESRSLTSQMQMSLQSNSQIHHLISQHNQSSQQTSAQKPSLPMPTSTPASSSAISSQHNSNTKNGNGYSQQQLQQQQQLLLQQQQQQQQQLQNQSRLTFNTSLHSASASSSAASSVNSSAQRLPAVQQNWNSISQQQTPYQNQNQKPVTSPPLQQKQQQQQQQLQYQQQNQQQAQQQVPHSVQQMQYAQNMHSTNQISSSTSIGQQGAQHNQNSNGKQGLTQAVGFRYDYSFLSDATAKSQNKQIPEPLISQYPTKY